MVSELFGGYISKREQLECDICKKTEKSMAKIKITSSTHADRNFSVCQGCEALILSYIDMLSRQSDKSAQTVEKRSGGWVF